MTGRALLMSFIAISIVSFPAHALGDAVQVADATPDSPQVVLEPLEPSASVTPTANRQRHNRLLLTGTLVGWLLSELAVLFGYLKIDHATRGFYSGRLQTIAAASALAMFGIACAFYFNWMLS